MTANELLEELEVVSSELEQLEDRKNEDTLRATPALVKLALMEVDDAYREELSDLEERYKKTEKMLKSSVIEEGQSVYGKKFVAVLGTPRISWDRAGLENYMKTNQYIRKFRKVGAQPVSIRAAAPSDEEV